MLSECIEVEGRLLNRRVNKFMKIWWDVGSATRYDNWFWVSKLFTKLVSRKLDCDDITTRNSRCIKIYKTPFEEAVEISNTQNVDNTRIDASQNNVL